MARRCDYCGRGPRKMQSRSKSMIATKRWQHINLQSKHIGSKRVKVCTKCLKTFTKRGYATLPRPGAVRLTYSVG